MIILIIAFIILYCNVHYFVNKKGGKLVDSSLCLPYTVSVYFAFLFVVTEVLSLIKLITFLSLIIIWTLFILVNIAYALTRIKDISHKIKKALPKEGIRSVSKPLMAYLLFGLFMIILAYHTTPYNSDSMAYHLPRIVQWTQNRSVWHFAGHYYIQNSAPVFAEYIQLHNYILSGYSDSFVCLTQCVAYIIDGILIYTISKRIGCTKGWSYVASIIFVSLPVTFGEALNTQVDLITPLFVLSLVIFILNIYMYSGDLAVSPELIIIAICMGICTGLAFLSKYTAAFAMIPFFAWLFVICIRKRIRIKCVLLYSGLIMIFSVLVFAPEASRLLQTFGTLFPSSIGSGQIIGTRNPKLIFLCFIKNISFNLSGHFFYNSQVYLKKFVDSIALFLGVDVVDPSISLIDYYDINAPFDYHHDNANGNIITILFLISFVIAVIAIINNMIKCKKNTGVFIEGKGYIVSSFFAFILFMSICRFTMHRSRYMILFFALLCPAVCFIFQNCLKMPWQKSFKSIIIFVCICEVISLSLYHNHEISYIGERPKGYFGGNPMYEGYCQGIEKIKRRNYKTLGIINYYVIEYPLWAMAKGYVDRIEDVNVQNASAIHEDMEFHPDVVFQIGIEPVQGETINVHGLEYTIIDKFNDEVGYYALAENPDLNY